jgi:hypothetical protein
MPALGQHLRKAHPEQYAAIMAVRDAVVRRALGEW